MTTDAGTSVTLAHLMMFFSAANEEPPLGFAVNPAIVFVEGNLAMASTCGKKLKLPYHHPNYSTFKYYMTLSVMGHGGYGQV